VVASGLTLFRGGGSGFGRSSSLGKNNGIFIGLFGLMGFDGKMPLLTGAVAFEGPA
jgi:hypothetical protein